MTDHPANPTPQPPTKNRVLLGIITGVHGIRGDVIVRSYTTDPQDIAAYGALETAKGEVLAAMTIVRVTDRGIIAHIERVTDRTTAEKLRGVELWIARDRLPPAQPGEYYHADLIGLAAVAPDGTEIGAVLAVENFGAGDLLDIKLKATNRSEYVPFTNAHVPKVDLENAQLTVIMPVLTQDAAEGPDDDTDAEPPI
jgi:16S rRNA processing protein RimM